jgi:hypothetical protein
MPDSPNRPDPRVIVGTYHSARRYCQDHGLDPRKRLIVTKGHGYKVWGHRFTTADVVLLHDADPDMSRMVYERARRDA